MRKATSCERRMPDVSSSLIETKRHLVRVDCRSHANGRCLDFYLALHRSLYIVETDIERETIYVSVRRSKHFVLHWFHCVFGNTRTKHLNSRGRRGQRLENSKTTKSAREYVK